MTEEDTDISIEENTELPTEENIEDYGLLKGMLYSQKKEFDLLSKKKADGQLNPMKIKMANRVLEPLKELLKNEKTYKFLDTLSEDEIPTNSDVVLIISQYEKAIHDFKIRHYSDYHWVTAEYVNENYEDEYYEDEDEDEDEVK